MTGGDAAGPSIHLGLCFHVNFYHSYRGDSLDERGIGKDIRIIRGILDATRFRITPGNHAVLKAELQRLRSGGDKKDATPETIVACELLSGQPWDKCWNRNSP